MFMIERLRQFLSTSQGKIVGIIAALILVILLVVQMSRGLGSSAEDATRKRTFVCSDTGKMFQATIEPGTTMPVKSPYSGRNTGYLAYEICSWTNDGHVSNEPTYVVL